ncbi:MAG: 4-diphosphocytidyl-2C-methyl-D-erythritol kinase [Alphaproteobacteria bacterium]|nr:MAG: 4-diphosphocytidyl-2C-methyl-D-erythritol kinase [Alphaproteobacteria bacterium]
MKFAAFPLAQAEGLILGHSIDLAGKRFKKGRRLSQRDLDLLQAAGIAHVTGARLGADDVAEDEAAARLAARLAGPGIDAGGAFTGRANLFAAADGLLLVDAGGVAALNRLDESVTLATLPPYARVRRRQMLATVKIIPFVVPRPLLEHAEALLAAAPPLRLAPLRPAKAGLVQTRVPGTKDGVLDKTRALVEKRLAALGSRLADSRLVAHEEQAVAQALTAMAAAGHAPLLVMGAAATVDRGDVVPAAIEAAGGSVRRFGMPVDPGNLLVLGELGGRTVIGLPGCARSPKLNGFDWVLERLLAGLAIDDADWAAMGVGGLLKEIPSRPQPREGRAGASAARVPSITALVLAAGQSRRMGGSNKLLAPLNGKPLIAHTVEAVLASRAARVVVVVGHEAERVRAALAALADQVDFVNAPDYAQGLSHSLRAGLRAVAPDADGVLICLGDMPAVTPAHIDRLIAAFSPVEGRGICVPSHRGVLGNPVLWAKRYIPDMMALTGDKGAKALMESHAADLCEIAIDDPATIQDVDTPESLNLLENNRK